MADKKKKSAVVAPVSAEDKKKALATALSQIEKARRKRAYERRGDSDRISDA